MRDSLAEYTAATAEQALVDRLLDESYEAYIEAEYEAYMLGEDSPAFDLSSTVKLICDHPELRRLALSDQTKITVGRSDGVLLITFNNGGERPVYDKNWTFNPENPGFDLDFPIGTAAVVYGNTVASAAALKSGGAEHRRAEAAYDADDGAYVFGGARAARKMAERGSAAIEAVGFGYLSIHDARHTYASLMIAAGVNAKALSSYMGHASIAITFDLYGHMLPGAHDEAAGLLDAFLARSAGADTDATAAPTAAHPAESQLQSDLVRNR